MEGYIFYLDLLAASYLSIKNPDRLKSNILRFHHIVYSHIKKYKFIKCIIISDSVFLYTTNNNVSSFFVVANIFRTLLRMGILCRAGCDYGKFEILPTKLHEYNILGEPVSTAVEMEKVGKGHRIFISENAYNNFNNCFNSFIKDIRIIDIMKSNCLVTKNTNYLNYNYIYTFNWLYVKRDTFFNNGFFYYIFNYDNIINMKNYTIITEDNNNIRAFICEKNNMIDYIEDGINEQIEATKKYINEYFDIIENLQDEQPSSIDGTDIKN